MTTTPKSEFIWHELVTIDVQAALAFYGHVVGWTWQAIPTGGGVYHRLEAGGRGMGGMVELTQAQREAGAQPGWVGYLMVPEVDECVRRLWQMGGMVRRPAEDLPQVGRIAAVSDPQGAAFIVFKPTPPPGAVPPRASGAGAVGWVELNTSDWQAAFPFYSELFGWEKAAAIESPAGAYQLFSAGAVPIGGMFNASRTTPPHWLFYFNVDSVDAALARVREQGGAVVREADQVPGGSWVAQARDPQGGLFALVAPRR